MKKIFLKIVLIFLASFSFQPIFNACCANECDTYVFQVTSIKANHYDNSGATPILVDSGAISTKSYFLDLEFEGSELLSYNAKFSLIKRSYAGFCDCSEDIDLKNPIKSITITSINDFDSSHKAGTILNDLFKMNSIKQINKELPEDKRFAEFYLQEEPTIDSIHQFITIVILEDNTYLNDTTSLITLKK